MSDASTVQQMTLQSVENARKPFLIDAPQGRTFLALPEGNHSGVGGWKHVDITAPNVADVLAPKSITQHVKMQTAESLIQYINCFKNQDTKLFADIANDHILGVIDYHREPTMLREAKALHGDPGPATALSDQPSPTLGLHRASLHLPKSLEWQTWTKVSGQLMSHLGFASFLEENAIDIVSPLGADLLELCRDLQVLNNVSFGGSVRDGDYTTVNYQKEADAASKGGIKLPPSIMLSIPVYFGEHPVPIMAFMRRKIDDGKLLLGVQLSRAENVRQLEFHRIVDSVTEGVDHLTTVYGTP